MVAIDDVQWLDPATRSLVEFAARRLRRELVALLLATRTPSPETVTRFGLVAGEVRRIAVGPLSVGAVSAILRERLGGCGTATIPVDALFRSQPRPSAARR